MGQSVGAQSGSRSIELLQIALTSPLTHRQTQAALTTGDVVAVMIRTAAVSAFRMVCLSGVRRRLCYLSALFLILVGSPAEPSELSGPVVSVADGDTLTILLERQPVKVRLQDIDAPERKQPFGSRSRTALRELCLGSPAQVVVRERDRYGRVIGQVTCNGRDANASQVSRGMAWVFDRYAPATSPLYDLQRRARAARVGLWWDPAAVPPWEWRRSKGE